MNDNAASSGLSIWSRLPGYRGLFWIAMIVCAGTLYLFYTVGKRIGDPYTYDPNALAAVRDVQFPFTIEVYGYKYKGHTQDQIDDEILMYGAHEKPVLHFLRDYLKAAQPSDAVCLDVGASTGEYSLFLSPLVKQVHAFEPYPPAIARFQENVQLNGFQNITLHELGLSDKEGEVPFHAPVQGNVGTGSFLPGHVGGKVIGKFKVTPGDQFALANVKIVKVDVESFEEFVLRGLAQTLTRNRPLVIIEVSRPPRGTIASLEQLRGLFPENYRFLRFDPDRRYRISGGYRLDPLDHFPTARDTEVGVAYPAEQDDLIQKLIR